MNQEHTITENSLSKLLRAGFSIYRIPPAYKSVIHYLKFGKWGPKWETLEKFSSANEADLKLRELLKVETNIQVK